MHKKFPKFSTALPLLCDTACDMTLISHTAELSLVCSNYHIPSALINATKLSWKTRFLLSHFHLLRMSFLFFHLIVFLSRKNVRRPIKAKAVFIINFAFFFETLHRCSIFSKDKCTSPKRVTLRAETIKHRPGIKRGFVTTHWPNKPCNFQHDFILLSRI